MVNISPSKSLVIYFYFSCLPQHKNYIIISRRNIMEIINEPIVLLAKGANASSDSITKLSRAILKSYGEWGFSDVQAIGPPAVNNTIKAYIKTKSSLTSEDNAQGLVCQFAYQKPQLDDKTRTAVRTRIFTIPSKIIVSPRSENTVLMAKGADSSSDNIRMLAQAMVKCLSEHNYAEVQAIGPVAVGNIIKAYIKSKGLISEYVNGLELVCQFSYQKPMIDDQPVTAVRAIVFAIPSKYVI